MPDVLEEKLNLLSKSPGLFARRLIDLGRALVRNDLPDIQASQRELSSVISETMMLADLLGRRRFLLEFDSLPQSPQGSAPARGSFSNQRISCIRFSATPVFPRTEFLEAFRDLISRDPRLAASAEEIRRVYATGQGFAAQFSPDKLADDARQSVTERLQKFLADSIREGKDVPTAAEQIREIAPFTKATAETIYRTNLATAYTAGRMQQSLDPEVREVVGAFEYVAVGDPDTRPNHLAADGLIASVDDPIWEQLSPPLGFNCRCDLRLVPNDELQSLGLLKGGFFVSGNGKSRARNLGAAQPDAKFRKKASVRSSIYR